jgi:hypothetical protein
MSSAEKGNLEYASARHACGECRADEACSTASKLVELLHCSTRQLQSTLLVASKF